MADIAGIIEGASEGLGMGFKFLKHIERTKVFIHIVDAAGSEGRDPIEDINTINNIIPIIIAGISIITVISAITPIINTIIDINSI